ncbi:butyrophilin subfamily 2 member A2-like [Erinaceus europaeus]|uniref:Butyrophilin subfamily 2 member A2-like n=1 Tax=Erinaceus europaeus TaxID=9365 RepID=A0ABM3XVS2_ERIEU|nr:butyrophilin subfamily 2 member A2-like [Erinaceus europaeus]
MLWVETEAGQQLLKNRQRAAVRTGSSSLSLTALQCVCTGCCCPSSLQSLVNLVSLVFHPHDTKLESQPVSHQNTDLSLSPSFLLVAAGRKALGEEGLESLRRHAEYITLDKDTAHPLLQVSWDRKYVRSVVEEQDVPDNPERFDTLRAILGAYGFSAGDHYWEVDVEWKDRWEIGLCMASVTRKGDIFICPENGFWVLSLENNEYKALSNPPSILSVREPILKLGIFLQYEKGLISFYNVTDCSLLYTFKSTFTKPLKPYFYPGPRTKGNTRGLLIPN